MTHQKPLFPCLSGLLCNQGQSLWCAWKCTVNSSRTMPKASQKETTWEREGTAIRVHQEPCPLCKSQPALILQHKVFISCESGACAQAQQFRQNYDMGRQYKRRLNRSLSHSQLTLITRVWRQGSPPSQRGMSANFLRVSFNPVIAAANPMPHFWPLEWPFWLLLYLAHWIE